MLWELICQIIYKEFYFKSHSVCKHTTHWKGFYFRNLRSRLLPAKFSLSIFLLGLQGLKDWCVKKLGTQIHISQHGPQWRSFPQSLTQINQSSQCIFPPPTQKATKYTHLLYSNYSHFSVVNYMSMHFTV